MADFKQQVAEILPTIDFDKTTYEVKFETNKGDITLELYPDVAPGHVSNLIALVKAGFYDGLTFHRVIQGFMIQGGCPEGTGIGGPGYTIDAEFNSIKHEAGVLSMARTMDPNSAGSQFFLCLETVPHLDNQYTVFGKAKDQASIDVIKAIGDVQTGPQDKPVYDMVIEKAVVLETAK